jgi:hypothetical protein
MGPFTNTNFSSTCLRNALIYDTLFTLPTLFVYRSIDLKVYNIYFYLSQTDTGEVMNATDVLTNCTNRTPSNGAQSL